MHLFAKLHLKLVYGRKCHAIYSAKMGRYFLSRPNEYQKDANFIVYHNEISCGSKNTQLNPDHR